MRNALFLLVLLFCSINASGQVTVTATKYHPGMGGAGWVTASGSRIDNNKLRNYEIKWIALSPDMFSKHRHSASTRRQNEFSRSHQSAN